MLQRRDGRNTRQKPIDTVDPQARRLGHDPPFTDFGLRISGLTLGVALLVEGARTRTIGGISNAFSTGWSDS